MEVGKIKDKTADRLLLEKTDNGIILADIGQDNAVMTKMVYEIWRKDGSIDFGKLAIFLFDVAETLKLPTSAPEINVQLEMYIEKIDKDKPSPLDPESDDEEEKDDENDR